ncbi:Major facilitator superfamily protein [Rhynchospora pubera]|uniref:Major facilitator superfamily protein n=1 Tax=Rhynchospora pubera TaxID=906938 RepID=A0AAV8GCE7_9POAL|nr:Major facilitator superfamily protein [Rhynchospora pubera]
MAGQSRKWMIVVATVWIQAFTGTNFDFSAYSSALKAAMGISQVQLNYLATASDLGKLFGWSSGLALLYLPLPAVLFITAVAGLVSYSLQWLVVTSYISLPYIAVFLLCLLAGCSICWFNTVCFVLCIRNFPINRSIALSLSISFNGVSAALYTLIVSSLSSITTSSAIYLLLNAVVPLIVSVAALPPILRQPPENLIQLPFNNASRDTQRFLILHILAFLTGLYLLFLNSVSTDSSIASVILAGAIFLLILPLAVPGLIFAHEWAQRTIYSSFHLDVPDTPPLQSFIINNNNDELNRPLIAVSSERIEGNGHSAQEKTVFFRPKAWLTECWSWCFNMVIEKKKLVVLGEEHSARNLIARPDFWFYYIAYFCGATVGLVYSNNLGQIAESLNLDSDLTMILAVYSACSFFGRLLSAVPDFLRGKVKVARTGWMALALLPMPVGLFLLAKLSKEALYAGTALIGLSSGFIFAAAVSVTSELFGANSIGVNHNILITNIPLGSLLYGQIAALVYDSNGTSYGLRRIALLHDSMIVCMGTDCYAMTFLIWGSVACIGLLCSIILFLRTRSAYAEAERRREAFLDFAIFED